MKKLSIFAGTILALLSSAFAAKNITWMLSPTGTLLGPTPLQARVSLDLDARYQAISTDLANFVTYASWNSSALTLFGDLTVAGDNGIIATHVHSPAAESMFMGAEEGLTTIVGSSIVIASDTSVKISSLGTNGFVITTGNDGTLSITIPGATGLSLFNSATASDGRTALSLGTMATQNSNSVSISGGSISGTLVNGVTFSASNSNLSIYPNGLLKTGGTFDHRPAVGGDSLILRSGVGNVDATIPGTGTVVLMERDASQVVTNKSISGSTNTLSSILPSSITGTAAILGVNTFTGAQTLTPAARGSGSASYLTITMPADTSLSASAESIGVNFTAATRQFAAGALATQREHVFAAPTYGFGAASTLTTAVNVDIADPIAGTNATLTNKYALRAATTQLTGAVTMTAGTASTSSTTGTLVVTGGMGLSGNFFCGGNIQGVLLQSTGGTMPIYTSGGSLLATIASPSTTFNAGTASTSTTTGTVVVTGGMGVSGQLTPTSIACATTISMGGNSAPSNINVDIRQGSLYAVSDFFLRWNSQVGGATNIFSGGSADTSISRPSAGLIAIGTGAANSTAGSISLTGITAVGSAVIGGTSINANSVLDVQSTTKAFMPPRMTKTQRDAIASPAASMVVYQTDNTPGLRTYNGTNWMRYTETAD